jgi:hypothetical protein
MVLKIHKVSSCNESYIVRQEQVKSKLKTTRRGQLRVDSGWPFEFIYSPQQPQYDFFPRFHHLVPPSVARVVVSRSDELVGQDSNVLVAISDGDGNVHVGSHVNLSVGYDELK